MLKAFLSLLFLAMTLVSCVREDGRLSKTATLERTVPVEAPFASLHVEGAWLTARVQPSVRRDHVIDESALWPIVAGMNPSEVEALRLPLLRKISTTSNRLDVYSAPFGEVEAGQEWEGDTLGTVSRTVVRVRPSHDIGCSLLRPEVRRQVLGINGVETLTVMKADGLQPLLGASLDSKVCVVSISF
jgi:hypothetical protein